MYITVRYESAFKGYLGYFTQPFEIGLRHLKVAFCDGSEETLTEMARERMIYRCPESQAEFTPLTLAQRCVHFVVGCLETVGYLTLIVPFIVAIADNLINKRRCIGKGREILIHAEEGGKADYKTFQYGDSNNRKNPFDANGKNDPFYQNASWVS